MIILILILGLVLRLVSLNQSLWLDEAISAIAAKNYSFVGLITNFLPGDTHPPLYYLLLKSWAGIFGFSEVSLRMPSVIFGLLTVFMVYLIGKKLGGEKLCLISGLLMATAPLHIYYSQEARMYAMSTTLIAIWLYGYMALLERSKAVNWIVFSAVLLLVGMTDYLPLVVLPAIWLYSLLFVRQKGFKLKLALSHLPLAGFFVLWLPTMLTQWQNSKSALASFGNWSRLLGSTNIKELALVWVKFITGRIPFDKSVFGVILFGLVSLVIVFALSKSISKWKAIQLVFVVGAASFILAAFYGLFSPGFSYFRLLFLLPFFCLLIAHGVSNLPFRKPIVVFLVAVNLMFASFYLLQPANWREDWRGLVGYIEGNIKGYEAVLMAFPEPFAGYRWYSKMPDIAFGVKRQLDASDYEIGLEVGKITKDKSGIYTLDYLTDVTDPERAVFAKLKSQGFNEVQVESFRGVGQIRYWTRL